MEIVTLDVNNRRFGLRGLCPHCAVMSLCVPVGNPYVTSQNAENEKVCVATQCQSCSNYVLLISRRISPQTMEHVIEAFYPVGEANDSVPDAVPEAIAKDFGEALRCFHSQSYKATVTMCRRALQASCKDLQAKGDTLILQIDHLAKSGKITEPLKDMAHQIRKIGNVGAHPDNDGLEDVVEQDANEIIEFTREYFAHIYVMPKKLAAMKERRSMSSAPASKVP